MHNAQCTSLSRIGYTSLYSFVLYKSSIAFENYDLLLILSLQLAIWTSQHRHKWGNGWWWAWLWWWWWWWHCFLVSYLQLLLPVDEVFSGKIITWVGVLSALASLIVVIPLKCGLIAIAVILLLICNQYVYIRTLLVVSFK